MKTSKARIKAKNPFTVPRPEFSASHQPATITTGTKIAAITISAAEIPFTPSVQEIPKAGIQS